MGTMYRWFMRPWLRFQDSERAHRRALFGLNLMTSLWPTKWLLKRMYAHNIALPTNFCGTLYPNPFGLAAGMDKNAEALDGWLGLGLGFVEIGGITQHEQPGNARPRMFRADGAQALVNRMGFNNQGAENVQHRLGLYTDRKGDYPLPLWVNLGKSKITSLEEAEDDYAFTMECLWPFASVFVVNVSSPNTPNLRELQNDDGLIRILSACKKVNSARARSTGLSPKPILVKVAPDMTDEQLEHMVITARHNGADGMVVANTTVTRPEPSNPKEAKVFAQRGGLSGQPVKSRSTEMIRQVYRLTSGEWPIVGVGGVASAADAWEKITAGATLVQAYSGFVFEGPSLGKSIAKGLERHLAKNNLSSIEQAVGLDHRS